MLKKNNFIVDRLQKHMQKKVSPEEAKKMLAKAESKTQKILAEIDSNITAARPGYDIEMAKKIKSAVIESLDSMRRIVASIIEDSVQRK